MGSLLLIVLAAFVAAVSASQPLVLRDCVSSDSAVMQLVSETISPGEIPIPGDLTISGTVRVNQAAPATGLQLDVTIQRYVGFLWVTVPCISDVGSCTYDDACALLSSNFGTTGCPQELIANNIPCTCDAIVPGDYSMNGQVFHIPKLEGLWSWLATGDYKVDIKLTDKATSTQVGCLHGEMTIVDPTACSGFLCSIFG